MAKETETAAAVEWRKIFDLVLEATIVGVPPSVGREDAFRAWLLRLCGFAGKLAGMTDTKLDDNTVKFLQHTCEHNDCWATFYPILMVFYQEPEIEEEIIVLALKAEKKVEPAAFRIPGDKVTAEQKVKLMKSGTVADPKLDPLTIIAIAKLILEIIDRWRNR